MRNNNERTDSQLVSGTGYPNQTHITSADVVDDFLFFGAVANMKNIVWQHAVPHP